eukprot:m.41655 g.41655  ORF g.41655 m.41655 type:complete len:467 (+) comp9795_c0_seq1:84-1484(+)
MKCSVQIIILALLPTQIAHCNEDSTGYSGDGLYVVSSSAQFRTGAASDYLSFKITTKDCPTPVSHNGKGAVVAITGAVQGALTKDSLIRIAVKQSRITEVWDFDVAPTPHTSHRVLYINPHKLTKEENYEGNTGLDFDVKIGLPTGSHILYISLAERKKSGIPAVLNDIVLAEALPIHVLINGDGKDTSSTNVHDVHQNSHAKRARILEEQVKLNASRRKVAKQYKLKHSSLKTFDLESHLSPELVYALKQPNRSALISLATPVPGTYGVYMIPILSEAFMLMLRDELDYAQSQKERISWTRPNTMNNFGFVLEELGLGSLLDGFLQHVVTPLAKTFLHDWSESLDSHHVFTIRYSVGEDLDLDRHMDLSEVTLNVCLGGTFEGADVYFDGHRGHSSEATEDAKVTHRPGYGLFHVGQHWHGSNTLTSGQRENLVFWGRSSQFQSSAAELYVDSCMHEHPPFHNMF